MRLIPALAVLSVLPLSGCGGAGPAKAAAEPALTPDQARAVLTAYEKGANTAGAAFDAKALQKVEAAPQLDMDAAGYRLRQATRQKHVAVTFSAPDFHIPRLTGFPRWFAASATSAPEAGSQTPVRHALLFRQAAAGTPWLLAADPYPIGGKDPLADVAADKEGYATAVPPGSGDLVLKPERVARQHAAILDGTVHGGLASGPQTDQAYKALQGAKSGFAKLGVALTTTFQPAAEPVYALRTRGGGAVVWYVLQQHESYVAQRKGVLSVTGDLVGLVPDRPGDRRLDSRVLIQCLAAVPKDGTTEVTGVYRKAVSATAS